MTTKEMAEKNTIQQQGEIILYQPDETIRLEVWLEDETVWLTQQQMGELFGTNRQAITKHLQNIYSCNELDKETTSSILELVRQEVVCLHADARPNGKGTAEQN